MTATKTAEPASKRWLVYSFLFFLGWVMMYADRSILAPVQELVRSQFALSNSQIGLISSVFFLVYVAAQIPSGILGDRMGRVKLIAIGFAIFGVATTLTGVAGLLHIFAFLMLMRVAAGLGEGLYYGPQYAKSNEETPFRYRALGAAIINSGQGIGTALGIMASTIIAYRLDLGWSWSFIVFGGLTLLVGYLIFRYVPESKPARSPGTVREELSRFGQLFRSRSLVGAFIMLFCGVYTFFVMVTWLPSFLTAEWSMKPEAAGTVASLPFWIAVPAGILMGHLSDRFRSRRPFVIALVPLTVAIIGTIAWAPSLPVLIMAIVLYGIVGKLSLDPVLISVVADTVPNELRSSAFGLYNCVGMAAAILAPYVTGALVDASGSFRTAFAVAAGLLVLGMTAFLSLYRKSDLRVRMTA